MFGSRTGRHQPDVAPDVDDSLLSYIKVLLFSLESTGVATLRERSPGRVAGEGVHRSRRRGPAHAGRGHRVGTKRDTLRAAANLESAPQRGAAGRTVGDVLQAWLEHKEGSYTPASLRDQTGRVRMIEADPIAKVAVARLGVADVDRWLTRMRRAGVGDAAAHNRHTALRAALHQAVVWGWITSNPAALTRVQRVAAARARR